MNSVDKLAKYIMGFKKQLGEFSLDLYYDDCANESECYVAKLRLYNCGLEKHFRAQSFDDALLHTFHWVVGQANISRI